MPRCTLACAGVVLCVVLLGQRAEAQEYYGVPIENGGVAFLLDVSGSMVNRTEVRRAARDDKGDEAWRSGSGTGRRMGGGVSKIELAQRELLHALGSLHDGTNFTIITFGSQAAEWPGGVRPMESASIAQARMYLGTVSANGGTAMAEALQLGFNAPDVRTLFVVSDGRPTTAEVLGVVRQLQESRKGRRMLINTVGIGSDQDSALLCRLARDNEGVYVRDREVACTFSPCSSGDGLVTFYPPESIQPARVTRICSSTLHPQCTAKFVYETMLAGATNCRELEDPPATIVVHGEGLEATTYTRPGNPAHPGKIMRVVKQQGDSIVVETTGAGRLRPVDYEGVDVRLIEAVEKKLAPKKPEVHEPAQKKKPDPKPKINPLPRKSGP